MTQVVKGIVISNNSKESITNIKIDSRKVNKGSLFIAIKGDNDDGHKYLTNAYNSGCRNFLVAKKNCFFANDINLSYVKDTKEALIEIGKYYVEQYNPYIVGITGSVGKTTTRNMVHAVLSKKYETLKNETNQNNEIGVPLTVFNLKKSTKDLVLEMGMDKEGDLKTLTKIANPNIAIITNIGLSHIGNFKNQDDIFLGKLEITDKFKEENILIINGDDKYLKSIEHMDIKYKLIKIGFLESNDLYCESYKIKDGKTYFKVNNIEEEFILNTTSKFLIYNALFAIQVGLLKEVDIADIKDALLNYKNEEKRLEVIKTDKYTIINDCYNSSLDSIKCAMDSLKHYENRRVAIIGDIKELGHHEKSIMKTIPSIVKGCCDFAIYIGDNIKYAADETKDTEYVYFKTKEDFYKECKNLIKENDVILVKASNSCKFNEIVDFIKK